MIVIADPGIVLWLSAVDCDSDLCLALWHRRQPGKVVLFALMRGWIVQANNSLV